MRALVLRARKVSVFGLLLASGCGGRVLDNGGGSVEPRDGGLETGVTEDARDPCAIGDDTPTPEEVKAAHAGFRSIALWEWGTPRDGERFVLDSGCRAELTLPGKRVLTTVVSRADCDRFVVLASAPRMVRAIEAAPVPPGTVDGKGEWVWISLSSLDFVGGGSPAFERVPLCILRAAKRALIVRYFP